MDVLLLVGCLTAACALAAPGIAMCLARSVVRYAPYSYALALPSSFLWCAYGVKHDMTALCLLSAGGAAIQVLYLVLFFRRAPADDERRGCAVRLLLLGALAVVVGAVAYFVVDTSREVEYGAYGWWCCFVASFAALSPFMNWHALRDMADTRTMRRMPPLIVPALALLNSVPWMIRNSPGFPSPKSAVLVVPGALTCLSTLIQLLLHAAFGWMGGQQLAATAAAAAAAAAAAVPVNDELHAPLIDHSQQAAGALLLNEEAAAAAHLGDIKMQANDDDYEALPGSNNNDGIVPDPALQLEIVVHDAAADLEEKKVDLKLPEEDEDKIKIVVASASASSTPAPEKTTEPEDDLTLNPTATGHDDPPQALAQAQQMGQPGDESQV